MAQDERREFEIVDDFPFMLRVSKHSEPFFSSLPCGKPSRGRRETVSVNSLPIEQSVFSLRQFE